MSSLCFDTEVTFPVFTRVPMATMIYIEQSVVLPELSMPIEKLLNANRLSYERVFVQFEFHFWKDRRM